MDDLVNQQNDDLSNESIKLKDNKINNHYKKYISEKTLNKWNFKKYETFWNLA